MIRTILAIALSLLAPAPAHTHAQGGTLCIRNARIYTVSGGVIDGGMVLVQDGRIERVGRDLTVSPGAAIIDGTGMSVIPGIVDASAKFGLRGQGNEQAAEVTPGIRAADLIDPRSPDFQRAIQAGVTCAVVTPGSANVVGGLCTVVKTAGPGGPGRVVSERSAVAAALGDDVFSGNGGFRVAGADALANMYLRRPNSRMGAVWELRHALFESAKYPALAAVRAGALPIRIHARVENDIRAAVTIADEFKLHRVVLDDCLEAFSVPDLLGSHHFSVVLGPLPDPQSALPEGADGCLNTAGILADKGVHVAFGSNGGDPGQLRVWAALAVRGGLSPELALRAVTLTAAEIGGVSSRVGSIESGKDADLVLLSGDPLSLTSRVRLVISNGQVVYEAR